MKRAFALLIALCLFAGAQPTVRGDLSFGTDAAFGLQLPLRAGINLRGSLEADYNLSPVSFRLVLDPSLRIGDETAFNLGLTELFALYRSGDLDVSVGVERLPLEYTRLSLPFTLERISPGGIHGVPNLRVTYYPDDWRIRAALLYRENALGGVISARRSFGEFELEGHALYSTHPVLGMGGSGLVGSLVLYGETWVLLSPFDIRGALGLTGYLGDALWTLEATYAPGLASPLQSYPQLAGQIALPQGENGNLTFNLGVALVEGGFAGLANATYSEGFPDGDFTIRLGASTAPSVTLFNLSVGVTTYF